MTQVWSSLYQQKVSTDVSNFEREMPKTIIASNLFTGRIILNFVLFCFLVFPVLHCHDWLPLFAPGLNEFNVIKYKIFAVVWEA